MNQKENRSRYPGLVPFNEDQHALFFGRDKETAELYNFLVAEQTVVLFAKSGAGKSSLLHAGLFPLLRKNGYHPVKVRFQYTVAYDSDKPGEVKAARTPLQILFDTLEQRSHDAKDAISINKDEILYNKEDPKLWEYLKVIHLPTVAVQQQPVIQETAVQEIKTETTEVEQPNMPASLSFRSFAKTKREMKQTPVLIFDQFEEFFNFAEPERHAFMQQLCEVLHNLCPNRIGEWLRGFKLSERTPQMMEWAKQPVVKCIIAIRDDKLSELDSLRKYIPLILKNRYKLSPLAIENAKQAMQEPAELEGNFISPVFSFDPDTLNKILFRLSGSDVEERIESTSVKKAAVVIKEEAALPDPEAGIDGSQLQQVCSYIERNVIRKYAQTKKPVVVDKNFINPDVEIQNILDTFYEDQLKTIGTPKQVEFCRNLIQDYLVSGRSRASLTRSQMDERLIGNEALLEKMLDARLIKREYTHLGETYELSHDSLIRSVVRAARQNKMNSLTNDNRSQRRQKTFFFYLFIISLILFAIAIRGGVRNYNLLNSNNLKLADAYYNQNNHYTAFNIWNSFPDKFLLSRHKKDSILNLMDSLNFFDISGGDKLVKLSDWRFAVHEKDNTIHLWTLPGNGQRLIVQTLTDAHNLEVSDSKRYLGYRNRAGRLVIYDVDSNRIFYIAQEKATPLSVRQRRKQQMGESEYRMSFMRGADLIAYIDSTGVHIYDADKREPMPFVIKPKEGESIQSGFILSDMKISNDKKFLALYKQDSFKVLDLAKIATKEKIIFRDRATSAFFKAAGNSICYQKLDSFIVIPFNGFSASYAPYRMRIMSKVYFSPDLRKCAFYDKSMNLVVFDFENHKADVVMGMDKTRSQGLLNRYLFDVEWAPDGEKIYYLDGNRQRIPFTVQQQRIMRAPGSYSSDGKYYCRIKKSGVLRVFDRQTGKALFTDTVRPFSYQVNDGDYIDAGSDVLRFSTTGDLLAYQVTTSDDKGYLKVVDINSGIVRYQSPDLWRVADFFTGDMIAVYDVSDNPGLIFLNGRTRTRQYYEALYPVLQKADKVRLGIQETFSLGNFFNSD